MGDDVFPLDLRIVLNALDDLIFKTIKLPMFFIYVDCNSEE